MSARTEHCRIPAGDFALEGCLSDAATPIGAAIVAPPHPMYGGTLSNPVVVAVCESLNRLGLTTLRFNFRGTGLSEGSASDSLAAAVADYQSAFAVLRERASGPFVFAGYSFGAGAALLAARDLVLPNDAAEPAPGVLGLVLIAPPIGLVLADDLAAAGGELLVVVGDEDEYAPVPELETRVQARPRGALEVIAGTDHFFHYGGLRALREHIEAHVVRWS
jgi:alpha/beta superfamily hydrolase